VSLEEVTWMSRRFLEMLLEVLAAADPATYAYYLAARSEARPEREGGRMEAAA
jgi:hypothetical protein